MDEKNHQPPSSPAPCSAAAWTGKGKLWYSTEQARIRQMQGHPPTQPGKLKDGREVQYTQINTGEYEDEGCLFPDAIYLGEGEYAGL